MYCHIFLAFVLLLFICFWLCANVCAADQAQEQTDTGENSIVEFFKLRNNINVNFDFEKGVTDTQISLKSIESINLVAVNGVMVALAEAIKNSGDQINLLAKFYEIEETVNWGTNAINEKEKNNWKVQLAAENLEKPEDTTVMKSSVVVAENTIFYYRFSSVNKLNQIPESAANTVEWKIKLFEGKITPESGTGKIIKWTNSDITVSYNGNKLKELQNTQQADIAVTNGFGFVIGSKKYILLVLKVRQTADSGDKYIIAVFLLEGNDGGKTLKFVAESVLECHPSFFQWGEKIIMRPTDESNCNSQNVMVFNEKEDIFTESKNPIAHLRDFLKNKKNFVNATIEGINVLLFIQQKTNEESNGNNAHLWMTDGSRVNSVDVIVPNIKDKFYGSLLYTKNELFLLYQTNEERGKGNNKIYIARLNVQLNKIKNVLRNWNKSNVDFQQSCGNTDITAIPCFTDGLVGVLSNTKEDNAEGIIKWKDDNLNMDSAIITIADRINEKAINVQNGFKFTGVSAGARWSVGERQEDQPYNFTDPGFTLVATVSINDIAKNNAPNSVLGVGLKKKTETAGEPRKSIRLWCTEKKKWAVSEENEENEETFKEIGEECEKGKTYIVAFVLNENENLEVYINGKLPTDFKNEKIKIEKAENITHFYFGADGDAEQAESAVTITNVLLYNRPFNTSEIELLKLKVNDRPDTQKRDKNNDNNQQENKGSTTENFSPNTSATKKEDEAQSSSKPTEDTAVRVGVLFLLLGIFAFLGCYI